ncbi:Alpha-2-macroglobulin [Thermoflexales bacterium]|nr:Alpha-2-macroglobulin [Thermoflexales bacterium]
MKPSRLLLTAGIAFLVFAVLSACGSPGPGPLPATPVGPASPLPPIGVTRVAQVPFIIPTATATLLPTPIPTKPRPGYTPVPEDVQSPQVIDQNPVAGQEAAPDGGIQLIFDRAMDRSAVESAFQVYPETKGTFNWKDDRTVVFTPAEKLARAGLYDVVVDQRAKDANGAPLNQAYQFRFATAGFLEVAQVMPAQGTSDAEAATKITVIFNRPVVPLTNLAALESFPQPVKLNIDGQAVEGRGEWLNTSVYVFTPARPLPGGVVINATVEANPGGKALLDTDGNPLQGDYQWQFGVTPPKVVYITPNNGAGLVGIETPIVVQFNQPISLESAREHVTLTSSEGQPATLNMTVLSETLTVSPTARLGFNTAYVVKVSAGLTSEAGGSGMQETYTSLFTTVPLPKIVSTEPRNGEENAQPYTPFIIHFNAPMNWDTVMPHVTFNPPLSPTLVYTNGYGTDFVINFGPKPSTPYEVRITPGIEDPYGNQTAEDLTVRFRTAELPPTVRLHFPDFYGTLNAYDPARVYLIATNINEANLKLYRLPPQTLFDQSINIYEYQPQESALVRTWSVPIAKTSNEATATPTDLIEGGGLLEPGLYWLEVDSPQIKEQENYYRYDQRRILVASRVHLTLKTAPGEALVWATDYRSGQPVPNLSITFNTYNGTSVGSANTDSQGLARLRHTTSEGVQGAVAVEPYAAISNNWSNGIAPYEFGLDGGYYGGATPGYNNYLYTDRPIYRPGQTVNFKGILRKENDVKYSLPDVTKVHLTIYNPNGETLLDKDFDVSELGTYFGELKLGDGAALGQYNIQINFGGYGANSMFTVAAYRAPEFEVVVTPQADEIVRGQSTSAQVSVNYFFGGGVANQPLQYNVLQEPYYFQPPWGGNYSWSDVDNPWMCFDCWWFRGGYTPPPEPILSGSGTTDANGNLTIEIPADLKLADATPITNSVRLVVEATVTGKDNQVISGRGTILRHSGDFYAGVATRDYMAEAKRPATIDLVAVDWEGTRLPGKALTVEIIRREYENKYIENETGGGYWQSVPQDIPVTTATATTNERGEASIPYTPPQAGSYKIIVKATDAGGREVRASVWQWVTGAEYVSWQRENNDRISLISDKSAYVPGETARILIPSPFQGEHWALVSIERGGILQDQLIKISSSTQIYELPITADLTPNVYVSVVVIKGQDATNKLSDYKVGVLPIEVKPIAPTLKISLTPDRATAQPGESVTFNLDATDSNGQPIAVEFSLDLVDKAVLSLLPRPVNAILEAFYGRRMLGVNTSANLTISINKANERLQENLDEQERQATAQRGAVPATGGGGEMAYDAVAMPTAEPGVLNRMEAPAAAPMADMEKSANGASVPNVEVREDFSDTAYWNPVFSTDANGKGSITLKLPDNLTTWTFHGVGVTADTKVGESNVEVMATKPLLIRPVTPRFFTVGDKAQLAANVSNNTENPLSVTFTLSATGVSLLTEAQQIVQIPAKAEGMATWTVEALDVENADLVFYAQAGDFADASKPRLATGPNGTLKVLRYSAPDIVGTGGQLKQAGQRTELIALPPRFDNRSGEVSIEVDPSLAAGMVHGLDYLKHYPYECTEQTVSRFLPNVLTYRALTQLGIPQPTLQISLTQEINTALDKLYNWQNGDGGWGWWSQQESNPYLTAYVVYGLIEARDAGFTVRSDSLVRGEEYLKGQLKGNARDFSQYEADAQTWFSFVLSEDAQAPAQTINALFDERAKLSHYAKAYLAMALGNLNKSDERIKTLLSDLNNAAIFSATGAHWEEDDYHWWAMTTDTRSTAIILDAYARLDQNNELAPNIVRWLMVARKVGYWETTQETAWALIALTDWMVATGELKPNYDYAVFLNDQSLAEGTFTPENVQTPVQQQIAIRELIADEANRLTFSRGPGEGVLYYTAHLRVFQPVEDLKPVEDRGIIVQRRYTLASCEEADRNKCPEVRTTKLGDVIRVDLTIIAPHDLYYLVVEDPLPAGAEAIDTGLATTSVLAQGPNLQPRYSDVGDVIYPYYWWWWRWYDRSELRDEKVVLFADYLYRGTYEYSYTMRATLPGEYKVIPTVANEFYFPEVFGRSDGRLLTITK